MQLLLGIDSLLVFGDKLLWNASGFSLMSVCVSVYTSYLTTATFLQLQPAQAKSVQNGVIMLELRLTTIDYFKVCFCVPFALLKPSFEPRSLSLCTATTISINVPLTSD